MLHLLLVYPPPMLFLETEAYGTVPPVPPPLFPEDAVKAQSRRAAAQASFPES